MTCNEDEDDEVDETLRGKEDCGKEVNETEAMLMLVVDRLALLVVSAVDVEESSAESEVTDGTVLAVVELAWANSCEKTCNGSVNNTAMRTTRQINKLEPLRISNHVQHAMLLLRI